MGLDPRAVFALRGNDKRQKTNHKQAPSIKAQISKAVFALRGNDKRQKTNHKQAPSIKAQISKAVFALRGHDKRQKTNHKQAPSIKEQISKAVLELSSLGLVASLVLVICLLEVPRLSFGGSAHPRSWGDAEYCSAPAWTVTF
jgi:hypothetical protein